MYFVFLIRPGTLGWFLSVLEQQFSLTYTKAWNPIYSPFLPPPETFTSF
jgi:hypothetical protein